MVIEIGRSSTMQTKFQSVNLGDLSTDERITLNWILKEGCEDVYRIHLSEWGQAVSYCADMVMNLSVP
jgi:hypothetical protein